jgi:hypothetical protein
LVTPICFATENTEGAEVAGENYVLRNQKGDEGKQGNDSLTLKTISLLSFLSFVV